MMKSSVKSVKYDVVSWWLIKLRRRLHTSDGLGSREDIRNDVAVQISIVFCNWASYA